MKPRIISAVAIAALSYGQLFGQLLVVGTGEVCRRNDAHCIAGTPIAPSTSFPARCPMATSEFDLEYQTPLDPSERHPGHEPTPIVTAPGVEREFVLPRGPQPILRKAMPYPQLLAFRLGELACTNGPTLPLHFAGALGDRTIHEGIWRNVPGQSFLVSITPHAPPSQA